MGMAFRVEAEKKKRDGIKARMALEKTKKKKKPSRKKTKSLEFATPPAIKPSKRNRCSCNRAPASLKLKRPKICRNGSLLWVKDWACHSKAKKPTTHKGRVVEMVSKRGQDGQTSDVYMLEFDNDPEERYDYTLDGMFKTKMHAEVAPCIYPRE